MGDVMSKCASLRCSAFIGFTLLAATVMQAPCPDLSGQYLLQGEDGRVEFLIQQRGCQEITMIRKRCYLGKTTTERHQVKIDGHFHIDSPWFGGREKIAISASFIGQLLEIIATPPRDSTSIYWKTRYELLPNKDLSIAEFQETTQTYGPALVAQRQR